MSMESNECTKWILHISRVLSYVYWIKWMCQSSLVTIWVMRHTIAPLLGNYQEDRMKRLNYDTIGGKAILIFLEIVVEADIGSGEVKHHTKGKGTQQSSGIP